jgi:hypothetical protein
MLSGRRIARMTIALSTVAASWTAAAVPVLAAEPIPTGSPETASGLEQPSLTLATSTTAPVISDPSLPGIPGLPAAPAPAGPAPALSAPALPATLVTPPEAPTAGQARPQAAPRIPQTKSTAAAPTKAARSAAGGRRSTRNAADRRAPRQTGAGSAQSSASAKSAPGRHGRSRDDSRRRGDTAPTPRPISLGDPAEQGFALSRFDRLGTSPDYPAPSPFLSAFGRDSGGELVWALQLLAVMLLIGVGGFLRISRPH